MREVVFALRGWLVSGGTTLMSNKIQVFFFKYDFQVLDFVS